MTLMSVRNSVHYEIVIECNALNHKWIQCVLRNTISPE